MDLNNQDLTAAEKRKESLRRAEELRNKISDYTAVQKSIESGFDIWQSASLIKGKILDYFKASEDNWNDWKWQMQHRITETQLLSRFVSLEPDEIHEINTVVSRFRWAISPYYLSLIEQGNPTCPIRLQSIPCALEMDSSGSADPMKEQLTSPASCITRRYPDRLIVNVTNRCPMYCRHCQRRRNQGNTDVDRPQKELKEALDYIRANPEIRDVLITGGDALLLNDSKLDWLLTELDKIQHVEIKRIGTRAPVTLPQRITEHLCNILRKHPPIYLNTQFNHPREITPEAAEACAKLVDAGVILGNQSVLLKGINNNPHIIKKLNQALLKIRVRPYYLFQSMGIIGTCHFTTDIEEGLKIIEKLRGYTSGLAIPNYVINTPGGLGKVPVQPSYLIINHNGKVTIKTWEGKIVDYHTTKV